LCVRRLGVGLSTGWAGPVDHLSLPHVLDKSSLAEGVYRLSDGGTPRFCAGRRRCDDAHCDLHGAYLGEPPPREVEGEAEYAALQRSV
jgi:hypothetical protein